MVAQAFREGVGSSFHCSLGAKFDKEKSSPIEAEAKVIFLKEKWEGANNADLALLEMGGVHVVVASKHVGCYDPEMMRILGAEPTGCKAIVVKLGYLEPEIRSIAKRSMMALTTGSTDELFTRLPYRELSRPIYPLDGEFDAELELI